MRVRIGCLHFVQKLNGKSRTIQLAKGSPAFNRFYVKKPTQRLTITWGSPCLTCIQKIRIKQKRPNLNLNELGCSAFIFSKQLNLEFTYIFWFAHFSDSLKKRKRLSSPEPIYHCVLLSSFFLNMQSNPHLINHLGVPGRSTIQLF